MLLKSPFLGIVVAVATLKVSEGRMVQALYDQSVNFTCDPSPSDLDIASLQPGDLSRFWILPDGEILKPSTTGHARVEVLQDGELLHVREVHEEDFGVYYCLVHVYSQNLYITVRHGLNVDGAYYGDLSKKYRAMATTGIIAGAVCLVTMGLLCFLYNRQQARLDTAAEQDKAQSKADLLNQGATEKPSVQQPMTEYANAAYVPDSEAAPAVAAPQEPVTRNTNVAYEAEISSHTGQGPQPPASATPQKQQQELQNVAAAVGDGASSGVHKTKL